MIFSASENFAKVPVASPSAIADNNNWFLSGISAACARATGGGVTLTTNAATDAIAELLPFTGSAWAGTNWATGSQLNFNVLVKTAASIADIVHNIGLSDYPTDITAITHDDETQKDISFVYQSDYSANWLIVVTLGNSTDPIVIDTKVPVVASTAYKFGFRLDSDRNLFMTINDEPAYFNQVCVFPSANLKPYCGLRGNAKALTVLSADIFQTV